MDFKTAEQHLNLQSKADSQIDARIDRIADRSWRQTDQTINGTARSFLMEAALLQRLPFRQDQ
jgi:hypothetical protein